MNEAAEKIDVGALYNGLVAKRDQAREKDLREGADVDELQRIILLKERLYRLTLDSFELADAEDEATKRGVFMNQFLTSTTAYVKLLDIYEKRRAKHGQEKKDG